MQKQILFSHREVSPLFRYSTSLRSGISFRKEVELLFSKHLLRLCLLLLIYQASTTNAKAQWVSIPDTAFASYLQATFPPCMSGNLMDTTCSWVVNATDVTCPLLNISNLEGIQYFDNLQNLRCWGNQISSLPPMQNTLKQLVCGDNLLTSLPTLPSNLSGLFCQNNNLSFLPSLPDSLHTLYSFGNQLTSLPNLPNELYELWCYDNHLTILPNLPNTITELYCYGNHLSNLPTLPNSLTTVSCYRNQLENLPSLPDSLSYLNCSRNPTLYCLPRLNKIVDFVFDSTGITCLPNYPQANISSYPALSTTPLCDTTSFNINGCGAYWNISGKVYQDTSADCIFGVGEPTNSGVKVQLYQAGMLMQQNYSAAGGNYSFDTDLSTYQYSVDTSYLPFILACPDSGYYTSILTNQDSFNTDRNLGLRCKAGFDLAAESMGGRFAPGGITQVNASAGDYTNFWGAHCAAGTNGSVQLIISGSAHYASSANGSLAPTTVSNDTVTWNIPDFGTVNFFTDFNINVVTDTNAVLGSQICFTLVVNPIAGDNNPLNNILHYCGTVVSSFDPNEKEVYPAGDIDTAQKWLTYTIHFQNTGTAEAQHIYVTDTLDSNVDASSFQLLAYSHQPMVQIKENAVRFNFPNINLPDSNTNEPLSHGYVQYKVKLKDNLPIGTNISNTAFIYFDFNSAVVTNTTSNTISLISSVEDGRPRTADRSKIHLQPNPASSSVNISVGEEMVGSSITVYDVTGRKMAAVELRSSVLSLPTSNFSSGVYFVTVENERGRVTKKLVIEK